MASTITRRIGIALLAAATVAVGLSTPASAATAVQAAVAGTGSISGTYTYPSAGIMGGQVFATPIGVEGFNAVSLAADGSYTFPALAAGDYQVSFRIYGMNGGWQQYAYGTTDQSQAAVITVAEGQTTTVNDTALGRGSVRVTATDSATGQPIAAFSTGANDRWGSTETGELVLTEVTAGSYEMIVHAQGYVEARTTVVVTVGAQAEVAVSMQKLAKITTKVVDAVTGAPVAGVCVTAQQPKLFRLSDGCESVSDAAGNAAVEVREAGKYQLFALPTDGVYGAQWVGAAQGWGVQDLAKVITVTAGGTKAGPVVKLDRAAVVAGTVRNPDGSTPSWGMVRVGQESFNIGGGMGAVELDSEGRYRIGFLGPYSWPLLFQASGQATQWSGQQANRNLATAVPLIAGVTTTYDYTLKKGTAVTVTSATNRSNDFVTLIHPATGDYMGVGWFPTANTSNTFQVLGPATLKIQIQGGSLPYWIGGDTLATATSYRVPAKGAVTFAIS